MPKLYSKLVMVIALPRMDSCVVSLTWVIPMGKPMPPLIPASNLASITWVVERAAVTISDQDTWKNGSSQIYKSSSTRSAISLTLIMMTASIFQGLVVIQVYAEPLFEEAIPTMSPTLGSVLLAVVGIVAGVVAAVLTECAGRRPLMIYSSFATGASCLLLGMQLQFHWGPHWLIAVNMYFFTMVYSFGAATVPYVLIAEVFLPDVKSFLTMVVIEWGWFCNSILLFIFNPLLKAIGLGPVFYLFGGVGVLTGVYSIFCLPETKGLTIDAIQAQLSKKKIPDRKEVY